MPNNAAIFGPRWCCSASRIWHRFLGLLAAVALPSCAGSRERHYTISDGLPNFGLRVMANARAQGALERVLNQHGLTKFWDAPPYTVSYGKRRGELSPLVVGGDDGHGIAVAVIIVERWINVNHSHIHLKHTKFAEGLAKRAAAALQVHFPNCDLRVSVWDAWSNPW